VKTRIISGIDVRGKRVLLVGLGVHGGGVGTAKWLLKQGALLRITDRKSAEVLKESVKEVGQGKNVTYILGKHEPADFRWADLIVYNPDVSPKNPAILALLPKKQNVMVANELTLFLERCLAKTIGITGTRGKTSTTLLITHILQAAKRSAIASGNVRGEPMLSILPRLKSDDIAVLELSSFQLELLPQVERKVDVAMMTNLHVDHLSRHGTMEEYAATKANLFRYQSADDTAVLNYDNAWVRKISRQVPSRICWYTFGKPQGKWCIFVKQGWVMERAFGAEEKLFPLSAWPMAGAHQLSNLLAAIAAVRVHGVTGKEIVRALKSWRGVPHRQEVVRTWKGHQYINDTTATSPDGALAALQVFPKALFIVGGTDKQLTFNALAAGLAKKKSRLVFLPGTATMKLQTALRRKGWKGNYTPVESMEQAVLTATQQARPGQAIVLSPGAASFGLFLHEFDRGEKFVAAVRRLGV
jgi:UDP-N-acetylmuramoylalanine--D-glutamate ligase